MPSRLPLSFSPFAAAAALLTALPAPAESPVPDRGRTHYMLQCQGCHRADGSGIEGSVPDLRTDGADMLRVPGGREFFVGVPGSANAPLTDAELADVLNYILREILTVDVSEDTAWRAFTPAEVRAYRAQRLNDVAERRARLIRAAASGAR